MQPLHRFRISNSVFFHTSLSKHFLFKNKKTDLQPSSIPNQSSSTIGSKIFKAVTFPLSVVGHGIMAVAAFGLVKAMENKISKLEAKVEQDLADKKNEPPYGIYLLNRLVRKHSFIAKILGAKENEDVVLDFASITFEPKVSKTNGLQFKYKGKIMAQVEPMDDETAQKHLKEKLRKKTEMTREEFMDHAWDTMAPIEKEYTFKARGCLNEKTNEFEIIKFEIQNRDGKSLLKWNEEEVKQAIAFVLQEPSPNETKKSWFSIFPSEKNSSTTAATTTPPQEIEIEFRETKK